jgi:hypothetical protein
VDSTKRYRPPWAGEATRGHHLYVFDVAGRSHGDPATGDDVADDTRLTVGDVLKSGVRRFTYTYDFGDDWEHEVVIEAKKAAVNGRRYPACTARKEKLPARRRGQRLGLPRSSRRFGRSSRSEAHEWSEWIGLGFDPEQFSVEIVDARVGARLKSQSA